MYQVKILFGDKVHVSYMIYKLYLELRLSQIQEVNSIPTLSDLFDTVLWLRKLCKQELLKWNETFF